MKPALKYLTTALLLLAPALGLQGCGCGFDCNSGNSNDDGPATLTLGVSDALPEDLTEVWVEIDSIVLTPRDGAAITIDTFIRDNADVGTFAVNLLDYPGIQREVVVQNLELDSGVYTGITLTFITGEGSSSYVVEQESGEQITLQIDDLTLPGFTLSATAEDYTIEFGLAQSLRSSNNTYRLTDDGVRVENTTTAASLSGRLDSTLFDTESPCDEKEDPESGNRVYIYQGSSLGSDALADVFTSSSANDVPTEAVAPFAVATLIFNRGSGVWEYYFGYLPPGDYTLAFACDTGSDDPVDFDNLVVPLPSDQRYSITLSESERASCDMATDATCE